MKKKFLAICLSFIFCFVGFIGLSGCHSHNYDADITYKVENNKAIEVKKCSCGKTEEHELEEGSYIIVTPENAQQMLDENINNKTIVFSDGNYLDLYLRPTAQTVSKIYGYADNMQHTDIEYSLNDLETMGRYYYIRNFENVVFVGTENAIMTGKIQIYSRQFTDLNSYDVIRNVSVTAENGYNYFITQNNINGLTIKNLTFNSSEAGIDFWCNVGETETKNVTIINNVFTGFEDIEYDDNMVAVALRKWGTGHNIENVVVNNNEIENYFQGIVVMCGKNVNIENNNITNIKHNAIAVQSITDATDITAQFTGNIVVKNNNIENVTNRAIKFNKGSNANIVIENNTLKNACDEDGEILQIKNIDNSSLKICNNKYNGEKIEEKNESYLNQDILQDYAIKITE